MGGRLKPPMGYPGASAAGPTSVMNMPGHVPSPGIGGIPQLPPTQGSGSPTMSAPGPSNAVPGAMPQAAVNPFAMNHMISRLRGNPQSMS